MCVRITGTALKSKERKMIMNQPEYDPRPSVTERATAASVHSLPGDIQKTGRKRRVRAGDTIDVLARHYAHQANMTAFMTTLREGRITLAEYRAFIVKLYPIVVSFNGGLIRSIAKIDELQKSTQAADLVEEILRVDHVRSSQHVQELATRLHNVARREKLPTLRALAGQLKEEQAHNDYYRKMLEMHGIDHEAVYTAFEAYLYEIPVEERDQMTRNVLTALIEGSNSGAFPGTSFSQEVLALCHYLVRVASDPAVTFIAYHAVQSAIEFALVRVVSESVFPGVAGTRDAPQLHSALVPDAGVTEVGSVPLSITWWDEHADYGQGGRIELQHVRHGREQLNRNLREESEVSEALRRADEVLRLMAAAVA